MSNDSGTHPLQTGDGDGQSEIDDIDVDAVLDALSHPHRRHALSYLVEADGPVPVDALYDHVADRVEPAANGLDTRTRVEAAFYHWHRSKLETDVALVEYDDEDDAVRATESAADLRRLLELIT